MMNRVSGWEVAAVTGKPPSLFHGKWADVLKGPDAVVKVVEPILEVFEVDARQGRLPLPGEKIGITPGRGPVVQISHDGVMEIGLKKHAAGQSIGSSRAGCNDLPLVRVHPLVEQDMNPGIFGLFLQGSVQASFQRASKGEIEERFVVFYGPSEIPLHEELALLIGLTEEIRADRHPLN